MNAPSSLALEPPRMRPRIALKEPFNNPTWTFELKYTGERCPLLYDRGHCRLFGTEDKRELRFLEGQISGYLSDWQNLRMRLDNAIFDGQVVMTKYGKVYRVFDILWLNDSNLSTEPLEIRQQCLDKFTGSPGYGCFRGVISSRNDGRRLLQCAVQMDLEGVIAKRLHDPYSDQVTWYKILNPEWSGSKNCEY